ncbi:MAG: choice-of-anchor tandem repeat GloVer-containing protein [Ginsengibacter sp.]
MKKTLTIITCFFACLISTRAQTLFSMTAEGGSHGFGVIFSYDPATSTYKKVLDFDSTNGSYPYGKLMLASNGKLYGMTTRGGSDDDGVLFSFDPVSSILTKLLDFDYTNNGGAPVSNFAETPDGKLYGMTSQGGSAGSGVIFSLELSSSIYTKLLDFNNDNGNAPNGGFIIGNDGKLYGMTSYGGTNDAGVIFSYEPLSSTFTKLKDFDYFSNGGHPGGNLLQASDGKLYGMTYDGGSSQFGVVFAFDPATSNYTNLKDFEYNDTNLINGAYPFGSLIQARNGNLYGMTPDGGEGSGVLFSIDPSTSAFTKFRDFNNISGSHPYGDLFQAGDGKLYGMTLDGGSSDLGVIFSFDPVSSVYTQLKDFGGVDGARPYIGSAFIAIPVAGPVPVTMVNFSGINKGNTNQLAWKVENEFLNYYELQRSNDGRNFKDIAQIKANGNNGYNYSDPVAGGISSLYYYRLKSVDKDGNFKYSAILKIRKDLNGFLVVVSPNPFRNNLTMNIESPVQDNAVLLLTDLNGKSLFRENRLLFPGSNVIEINKVARLSKGTYLLEIITSQKNQVIKVIKAN